jgi:hypothetical protein
MRLKQEPVIIRLHGLSHVLCIGMYSLSLLMGQTREAVSVVTTGNTEQAFGGGLDIAVNAGYSSN